MSILPVLRDKDRAKIVLSW